MRDYHHLLVKQLRATWPKEADIPKELQPLLKLVSETYKVWSVDEGAVPSIGRTQESTVATDTSPFDQTALAFLDEHYRQLINVINEGLSFITADGVLRFANERFFEIYGFKKEEIVGKSAFELLIPPGQENNLKQKLRLRQKGISDTYELEMKHKAGHLIWVRINGKPLFASDGTYLGSIGLHTDVTDQRRIQEELRQAREELEVRVQARTLDLRKSNHLLEQEIKERKLAQYQLKKSQKRFRDLFLNSPDAIFVEDLEGNILDVNHKACELHKMEHGELIGKSIYDLVPKDKVAETKRTTPKTVRGEVTFFESVSLASDGSVIPVEINVSKVEFNDKPALLYHVRDITERKKNESLLRRAFSELEERVSLRTQDLEKANDALVREITKRNQIARELEEQQRFLRTIIDTNPNLIFVKDDDGRFILVNRAVADIYNTTVEEMEGSFNEDFSINPEEVKIYTEQDRMVIETMNAVHIPDDHVTNNSTGETRWFQTLKVPLDPLDGKRHILGISTDITEIRRAKDELEIRAQQLAQSNEELEKFAYVASHDLQEPLRTVASYVQLLSQRYDDNLDDNAREFVGFAVDGVKRMQMLIHDLLQYSRINSAARPFEQTDMNHVAKVVCMNLNDTIENSGAEIDYKDLPTIKADQMQMVQLFQNLIENGIKFRGDKKPHITITAKQKSQKWQFCISDNGLGINEKFKEKIFVIFQRLHTRDKYPGTGIGLAICKKIVERHKGEIWFESAEGEGTQFYFTINKKLGE